MGEYVICNVNYIADFLDHSLTWEKISSGIAKSRLKLDQGILETLQHMVKIHEKKLPGFKVVDTDNAFPLELMEYALNDVYKCKYPAKFMQIAQLNEIDTRNIFYSLLHPTMLSGNPNLIKPGYCKLADTLAFILDRTNRNVRDEDILPIKIYGANVDAQTESIIRPVKDIALNLDDGNLYNSRFFKYVVEFDAA